MKRMLYLCDGTAQEARELFKARAIYNGLPWESLDKNLIVVPRDGRPLGRFEVEALILRHGAKLLVIDTFDVSASEAVEWERMVARRDVQMIAYASASLLAQRLDIPPEQDGMIPAYRNF